MRQPRHPRGFIKRPDRVVEVDHHQRGPASRQHQGAQAVVQPAFEDRQVDVDRWRGVGLRSSIHGCPSHLLPRAGLVLATENSMAAIGTRAMRSWTISAVVVVWLQARPLAPHYITTALPTNDPLEDGVAPAETPKQPA